MAVARWCGVAVRQRESKESLLSGRRLEITDFKRRRMSIKLSWDATSMVSEDNFGWKWMVNDWPVISL